MWAASWSLERAIVVGPTVSICRKAVSACPVMARASRPPGVEERGTHAQGFPRNLGGLPSPAAMPGGSPGAHGPGHRPGEGTGPWSERTHSPQVPSAKGNRDVGEG